MIDDGTMPGLFGTSPFDDEGVPSRRTVVIEHGVLKSYLLNTYTARKLGLKTTGNASRGITGNAGIGHGNFFLKRGVQTPEQIIAGIPNGFYVTELIGFGVNTVTGDYSRGAAGLWIRNGELAFPVPKSPSPAISTKCSAISRRSATTWSSAARSLRLLMIRRDDRWW